MVANINLYKEDILGKGVWFLSVCLVVRLRVQHYVTAITFRRTASCWNKTLVPGKATVCENSHSHATEKCNSVSRSLGSTGSTASS